VVDDPGDEQVDRRRPEVHRGGDPASGLLRRHRSGSGQDGWSVEGFSLRRPRRVVPRVDAVFADAPSDFAVARRVAPERGFGEAGAPSDFAFARRVAAEGGFREAGAEPERGFGEARAVPLAGAFEAARVAAFVDAAASEAPA
jgi:hypothetical protein